MDKGYIPWGCKESNMTEGLFLSHMYNFICSWLCSVSIAVQAFLVVASED